MERESWAKAVREPYFESLLNCLQQRFPDMPLLASLGIFNPVAIRETPIDQLSSFGCEQLHYLLELVGRQHTVPGTMDNKEEIHVGPLVNTEHTLQEWTHVKSLVQSDSRVSSSKTTAELIAGLHKHFAHELQNILRIADWWSCLPSTRLSAVLESSVDGRCPSALPISVGSILIKGQTLVTTSVAAG